MFWADYGWKLSCSFKSQACAEIKLTQFSVYCFIHQPRGSRGSGGMEGFLLEVGSSDLPSAAAASWAWLTCHSNSEKSSITKHLVSDIQFRKSKLSLRNSGSFGSVWENIKLKENHTHRKKFNFLGKHSETVGYRLCNIYLFFPPAPVSFLDQKSKKKWKTL